MNRVDALTRQLGLPSQGVHDLVEMQLDVKNRMGLLRMKYPLQRRQWVHHIEEEQSDLDRSEEEDLRLRTSSPGSLSAPLRYALIQAIQKLEEDDRCSFIAISSISSDVFSLGIDTFSFDEGIKARPTVQELCECIVRCSKPTVAVLHGKCFSWGLEMALCTTFRVGISSRSWLRFPEAVLATIPASVLGIQALVRRAGVRATVQLLCGAETLTAKRAKALGLLDEVWSVPQSVLLEEELERESNDGRSGAVHNAFLTYIVSYMQSKLVVDNGTALRSSANAPRLPYKDAVTLNLVPRTPSDKSPGVRTVLAEIPQDVMLWSQVRMFCAWAAHLVSECSDIPRRFKSLYFLIESIRVATIRHTRSQHRQQVEHLRALLLKCTKLAESLAVQHMFHCIQRQYCWRATSCFEPRRIPQLVFPRGVSMGVEALEVTPPPWVPPPQVRRISIVAEDTAQAAFLAGMLLHSCFSSITVTILCLSPYHHGSLPKRRPFGKADAGLSQTTARSASDSSSDSEEEGGDQEVGSRRRKRMDEKQMLYRCNEELRGAVLDYIWLFRRAVMPDNGPESPSTRLRERLGTQLRIINVHREPHDGGWHNVPRSFYMADMLIECAYPWTSVTSSFRYHDVYSSRFQTSSHDAASLALSAAASGRQRGREHVMTEQRLRRYACLDSHMQPNCIFVCTTAATDMNVLAHSVLRHRDRLLGAFFSPRLTNDHGVVEVCHSVHINEHVLHFALHFFQQLQCYTAVVRSPVCGYVLCRVLFAGLYQAHSMLLDGCFPIELERAMRRRFHSKVGLLEVEDLWGLDWCAAVRDTISAADLPRRDVEQVPREMIQQHRVGRRTGEGWFRYDKLKGREYYHRHPDRHPITCTEYAEAASMGLQRYAEGRANAKKSAADSMTSVLPLYAWPPLKVHHTRRVELDYVRFCRKSGLLRRDVTEIEMTERMCLAMAHEAVRLLSDGVVSSSKDIDLLSLYGLGFPATCGGLLFEADQMGDPKAMLYKMKIYGCALGDITFPVPCRAVVQMAAEDKTIHVTTKEQFSLSQLSNGLRVITCDDQSGVMGMGLFMLNGAKFEDEDSTGAAAVLESMPLRGGMHAEVSETLGMLGNAARVINNKEALAVLLMVPGYHCREGLELLNVMALHPTQDADEFVLAKQRALERSSMATRDGMSMCLEMLHEAGWNGKGLGNPLNPSPQHLEKLTLERFTEFYRKHTIPERCVVAATGVMDHESFVEEVEKTLVFDFVQPHSGASCYSASSSVSELSSTATQGLSSTSSFSEKPLLGLVPSAPYTGGVRLMENTAAPESMNKFEEKNLSHMALFFKGIPLSHPDYYTVSVMQTLLGGGTSFSSGGPGKGMHTKIYREVLTREPTVHGLECITAWYSDGGLIGLYGSTEHEHVDRMLQVMLHQCLTIPERISEHHLNMAKNQMCSQLILLGETREQLLSDMGLNLLVHNYVITPEETGSGAKKVTMEDICRVSREIVQSPPSFAVYGCTSSMPSFTELQALLKVKQ